MVEDLLAKSVGPMLEAQLYHQPEGYSGQESLWIAGCKVPDNLIFGKYLLSWTSSTIKIFSSVKWEYLPYKIVVKMK